MEIKNVPNHQPEITIPAFLPVKLPHHFLGDHVGQGTPWEIDA